MAGLDATKTEPGDTMSNDRVEYTTDVLPMRVQRELAEKWVPRCSGCGHKLFVMTGSVIQLKCNCNVINNLTIK